MEGTGVGDDFLSTFHQIPLNDFSFPNYIKVPIRRLRRVTRHKHHVTCPGVHKCGCFPQIERPNLSIYECIADESSKGNIDINSDLILFSNYNSRNWIVVSLNNACGEDKVFSQIEVGCTCDICLGALT